MKSQGIPQHEHLFSHAQRFLIYLKLFVGMGFIWVFEIAAGLISSKEYFW